ncbi:hypothetical protein DOK76_03740 [Vagococcus sp. DIV0080]|uniref:Uncharacterized protein n=1 Tax=Candidatus Vagococcus giribetii TaxID=2230876 RepID=A0ABS3HQZ1_9ENTE|nr:hypothetical protein [Vagococcus sp. DIV0080]MBO0476168.1 hypothetical protein [Vagococcus sp. DIV0080]
MAINNSLLARIKKMEEIIGPDIIPIPRDKRKVTKIEEGKWKVFHLTFEVEQDAVDFSKRLTEQGLTAYLDEILNQLAKDCWDVYEE